MSQKSNPTLRLLFLSPFPPTLMLVPRSSLIFSKNVAPAAAHPSFPWLLVDLYHMIVSLFGYVSQTRKQVTPSQSSLLRFLCGSFLTCHSTTRHIDSNPASDRGPGPATIFFLPSSHVLVHSTNKHHSDRYPCSLAFFRSLFKTSVTFFSSLKTENPFPILSPFFLLPSSPEPSNISLDNTLLICLLPVSPYRR